jgi:pectin methylesterase-like acyl-CoA thioesterase
MLLQGRTVTSHHPVFQNILRSLLLQLSEDKLGLKTNLLRWNSKEIELSLQNIVEKTSKTTTGLNTKTILAALNALPTNKKKGR